MNTWLALKAPATILGLLAGSLLILWTLISNGITQFITPEPADVAQQFVQALGTQRYDGALEQLNEELSNEVEAAELRTWAEAIHAKHGSMITVQGVETSPPPRPPADTARVRLKFEDGQELTLEFPVVQENGLWKISSIEPLETLS